MKKLSFINIFSINLALLVIQPAFADQPTSFMDYFKNENGWVENILKDETSGLFTIQISTTYSTQEAGQKAIQTIAVPTYLEVFKKQVKIDSKIPDIKQIEIMYRVTNPRYQNLSLAQRALALRTYLQQTYGVRMTSETILSALTIEQIKSNPGQISSITNQVKNDLSMGQKVYIVSHFGGLFADDYNYDRVGANNPKGYVPLEDLVQALSTAQNGGVCRDISLAQGQLLNQLGVPSQNIYTMAYQTPTSHHAVLVLQDPESDQIIKINYGTVTTSNKAGSAGLNMDGKHQVSGIQYKFYDVHGKPVVTQDTAFGRLLKDVTGGTPIFGDSLAPYNVSKVVMSTQWGPAAVFTGNLLDTNDKVTGVAFNSIDLSNFMGPNTEVGIAIVDRASEEKAYSFNQKGLFLNLRTMRDKDFAVGPVFASAQIGAESQLASMYTTVEKNNTKKSSFQNEYQANFFTALNANYKNHEAGVLAVGYVDFNHIAKANSGGYTLNTNYLRLHTGTKRIVGNNIQVSGKALLTVREVGNTLNFESSALKNNNQVSFNYQKPLDNIPFMFDGSTEVFRFRGQNINMSQNGRKQNSTRVDIRYDKDQKEAQAEFGLTWRW